MKTTILAILTVLGAPSVSFAVRVSDCPNKIAVQLSNLQVISAEQLSKEVSQEDDLGGYHEALRKSLENTASISMDAAIDTAANSRCTYKVLSSVGNVNEDEFVLATSKGKDWIRFRLNGKDGIIGGYLRVSSYSKDGIETTGDAPMGLDDTSHPGNFNPILARAKSVEVR